MKIDISIITINYNSSHGTLRLIDSILNHTSNQISYEIIVVDNNSTTNELNILEENIPKLSNIKLVKSRINVGFGSGNMLGFHYAEKSDYVVFINNDVIFKEDSLLVLYEHMNKNPKAGVCGPKMEYIDSTFHLISFNHFYNLWIQILGVKWYERIFNRPKTLKDYTKPIKVDYTIGSFLFFRTYDFEAIGGFDTHLFLYYEEMDTGLRLKKIGKERHFVPLTTYFHEAGLSTRKIDENLNLQKEQQISYHYIFRKHYSLGLYVLLYLIILVKHSIKSFKYPKIFLKLLKLHLQFNPMHKSMKYNQKFSSK